MIHNRALLTGEHVKQISKGVTLKHGRWICSQCHSTRQSHFYQYRSVILDKKIVYCRNCVNIGRVDNMNDVFLIETHNVKSSCHYQLPFELSEQQQFASKKIVTAIAHLRSLLLHAVTGAGKTEMIFEGIKYARNEGLNIAIVSPRVDVVIEVSMRIKKAFVDEDIDVLHQSSQQQFDGHFVIATVHQLYRFKQHFDLIIVDEVDAFPLSVDPTLMQTLVHASKFKHCHILMTATPPRVLMRQIKHLEVIALPARFHRYPLPVPRFQFLKINPHKKQYKLLKYLQQQIEQQRYTLVFFNNIDVMKRLFHLYKNEVPSLTYVYSDDALRFDKIERLRRGDHQIVFTTTILERGFTMAYLDVLILNSHLFEANAIVQIAGRVGRKAEAPTGLVLCMHEGITLPMLQARHSIKKMNKLAQKRGWID
ncbi:DNA/RNA helicase [Staphylococcus nepalensis]|uniref:DEAD/DEAH box helicase family protein n=2 Tax=Staphylococcus nepalensis TaxID=214473 RepID=A0A2T4SDN4_9STAP|nr:DEAD/DEAH box helicase family protein [Staphylococcus nepalensis]MBO1216483.1 DEAD/DEAH box helicase family protein [Staphylococcus nepalensis]MBO1222531.1 DEAD/DEAH box helicase family protein [Staphylococcus nepalensis]MBO1226511.1 DEAD/DEAH box helicase family protein [Staphylococcus nepalensis]MBO1233629.1 DEAD/DEAH box helicase family protein [Staphylococcus nepalensis]